MTDALRAGAGYTKGFPISSAHDAIKKLQLTEAVEVKIRSGRSETNNCDDCTNMAFTEESSEENLSKTFSKRAANELDAFQKQVLWTSEGKTELWQ